MAYSQILPNLYLGNQYATSVIEPVDAVLSIGCNHKNRNSGLQTLKVSIPDSSESDITPFLNEATQFIHEILSHSNKVILVHCKGGINRSPAFVVAYLAKYCEFSLEEAVIHVKSKRKGARFQPHYVHQISSWLSDNDVL
jgi:protein-tyrosine phosphatase